MWDLLGVACIHPLLAVIHEHRGGGHAQRGRDLVGSEDTMCRQLLTTTKSFITCGRSSPFAV